MALLAELGRRQLRAVWYPSVAPGVACGSGSWLFGAVGPAQPDQAVLAKADVAVQTPSSAEGAAVADTCPVAPLQLAQRPHRERARAGAGATGNRAGSRLAGPSRTRLQEAVRCG